MDLNFVKGKFLEDQLEAAIIELFQAQDYPLVLQFVPLTQKKPVTIL